MSLCLGCMEELPNGVKVCPHCGYRVGQEKKEAYYLDPGTKLNQQYIVGKVLGYGGFGVTYVGWDTVLKRKVAIKEYLPSDFATRMMGSRSVSVFSEDSEEQFQSGLKSFISEARKLAKFNDIPEIVDIYDCFLENETGYIVMEYLYGHTVKEMLLGGKAFSYDMAIRIICAILEGLAKVHRAGIIHRDIAPDNIFITDKNEIRLLDFGAARYATTTNSKSLSVILKPGYAPEEQYRSKGEQGPWTDVYGAAATLYRMITGKRPLESIERLMEDRLKTPSELGIEIPENVENTLMNALNVKKEYRIQTADEFLEALGKEHVERIVVPVEDVDVRTPGWVKALAAACGILVVAAGIFLFQREFTGFSDSQNVAAQLGEGQEYLADMTGLSYDEAKDRLGERYTLVISGKNFSTTVAYNKILSQDPEAGQIINQGDEIQVVMSGGTREVTMPDLEALSREEAIETAAAQGLVISDKDVTEDYNDLVEKGRVYEQSTAAGEKVAPGSIIHISISKGRLDEETALLKVPKLVGMTRKKAQEALEAQKKKKGFTYPLGEVKKEYSTKVPKGQIISQTPKAGTEARTNTAISLVISKGPKMVEMPDVVYLTREEAEKALEKVNLSVSWEDTYSSEVKSGSVVSQSIDAGKQVAEGSSVTIHVSIGERPQSTPSYSGGGNSGSGSSSGSSGGGSSGGGWEIDNGGSSWEIDNGGGSDWEVD